MLSENSSSGDSKISILKDLQGNNFVKQSTSKIPSIGTPPKETKYFQDSSSVFMNSIQKESNDNRVLSSNCTVSSSTLTEYPSNHLESSPQMNIIESSNVNTDRQQPYQQQTLLFPKSDSISNFTLTKPCLHFVNGAQQHFAVIFECREGWRINDPKTKHPHSTTHNCSIKDHLVIEGNDFENCKSFLKLKDNQGGKTVTEAFFTFDPKTRKHVVEFQVVSKINNMKGNTSSRVAYIDIYDSSNKLICVSDSFWVRSRSRGQMMLDMAKRKKEPSSKEPTQLSHSTTSSNDSDEDIENVPTTLSNAIEDVQPFPKTSKQPIPSPQSSATTQSTSDPLSSLANVASSIAPLQDTNSSERLPSFADLTLSSPQLSTQESPMKEASLPHIDSITNELPYRKRKISDDSRIRSLTLQIEKNCSDITKLYKMVEEQNQLISDLSLNLMQLCKKQKQQ